MFTIHAMYNDAVNFGTYATVNFEHVTINKRLVPKFHLTANSKIKFSFQNAL